MPSRPRPLPKGFIRPCLPVTAPIPPSGEQWWHEIKHDGLRMIARKDGATIRLYGRTGNDLTQRFPLIVDALASLSSNSCILDGEAVACGDDGVPSLERLRSGRNDARVFLFAFDLIEVNGNDMRASPLQQRKAVLAKIISRAEQGIQFNEHTEEDGPVVLEDVRKLGLEGIVSKRKGSRYVSGRSESWVKCKNRASAAGRREAEEG
jgi:bifunctional non-homologous end joining protein LigD